MLDLTAGNRLWQDHVLKLRYQRGNPTQGNNKKKEEINRAPEILQVHLRHSPENEVLHGRNGNKKSDGAVYNHMLIFLSVGVIRATNCDITRDGGRRKAAQEARFAVI